MINARFKKHTLNFTFDAGTSRGVLKQKNTWFVIVEDQLGNRGIGEAGPLVKLSLDDIPDFDSVLDDLCKSVSDFKYIEDIRSLIPDCYPSIQFAFETAWLDLHGGSQFKIFDNKFWNHGSSIPINGLIWMNTASFMKQQIDEKLSQNYKCIKIKVGAIDFDEELEVISYLRKKSSNVIIRLDANGAWTYEEAIHKLTVLKKFNIHSIEQPIKPKQVDLMAKLCQLNIIPIALDEELIGVSNHKEKLELLKSIQPQYIILKPTLLGGFGHCDEWISLAESLGIGWWNTSALESNIGLNAICQYSYHKNPELIHGLGTGMLYSNNIASPLEVSEGEIRYNKNSSWKFLL